MKKLLTILLTLTCATSIFAYDCKIDGIYYYLNNGTMTATVTNETGDYRSHSYSGSVVIPSSITYESKEYSVTTIGSCAFYGCTGLTSITIPNSVTTIGYAAFQACSGLTSVTILYLNVKIGDGAFNDCTIANLYCGEFVDLSNAGGTFKNVHRLSIEKLASELPFDQWAKVFVESQINKWQKKGEFEKTSDWQARVNETIRKQKIDSLVRIAKKTYLTSYRKNNNNTFTLKTYDADNEVYLVQSSSGQDLLVAVPIADASYVKQNWASSKASPKYDIPGIEVVITSVDFTFPNKKTYTYKPNQKLTYATADINYNFAPIELPEMQTVTMGGSGAAQIPQGINSISIATPFDINPASSVLASYKNIFGKYEMPEKDVTFPYVVIRVILSGTPQLISMAKQSLALDLGQSYITEQTVPQEDKILFLVPTGVKNIYLTSGNGQRQLIYSGRLQANKIYDGVVEVK